MAIRCMLEGGDVIPLNYYMVMDSEQDADNLTREVLIAVRRWTRPIAISSERK